MSPRLVSWLQVAPLALVLVVFFIAPLGVVVTVSFWDYDLGGLYSDFILLNYQELFTSPTTYALYARTLGYAAAVWAVTVVLGFTLAYFLVFHVRSFVWMLTLFLLCTVPFWTSVVIRTIAWVPFLGLNGLFNQSLIGLGIIDAPLELLLFSDFAVILAYVHLFTMPMLVPIANSMFRIEPELLEAAADAGAGRWQVIWAVVLPLSRNGIILGTVLVVSFVVGDFFTVRIMSGGKSASVASAMSYEFAYLQYPPAAASAVVLMILVVLMVAVMLRIVDVQKSLTE